MALSINNRIIEVMMVSIHWKGAIEGDSVEDDLNEGNDSKMKVKIKNERGDLCEFRQLMQRQ